MNKVISANRRIEIEEVAASKWIKVLTTCGIVGWGCLALLAGLAGFFSEHGTPREQGVTLSGMKPATNKR
jgi:hypothetical protein